MRKIFKFLMVLLIPFIFGFVFSRYGPWWGLREQGTAPDTPSNGIKLYADSNNDLFVLQETGTSTLLNSPTSLGNPATSGTLSIGSGSITDSSGAISFGDETLSTTGGMDVGVDIDVPYIRGVGDSNTSLDLNSNDRFRLWAGGVAMIDGYETTQDRLYLGYSGSDDIDVSIGPDAAISIAGDTGIVTLQNYLRTATAKWYHRVYMGAISRSPGGSGATLTVPSANTLGGYQLDAANEYLYFSGRVCSDWSADGDILVKVFFEVNVNNAGGNAGDTVDFSLLSYFKGDAETTNKTQTDEVANVVGQSAQYKQFASTHTIDYDAGGGNSVDADDTFSFRINLETDTSEVDDVIINFLTLSYPTKQANVEI